MKKVLTILSLFTVSFTGCNSNGGSFSTPTENVEGEQTGVSASQIVGVVSVPVDGAFEKRSDNGIERRLRKEAENTYGRDVTIVNIRQESGYMYADVIKQ